MMKKQSISNPTPLGFSLISFVLAALLFLTGCGAIMQEIKKGVKSSKGNIKKEWVVYDAVYKTTLSPRDRPATATADIQANLLHQGYIKIASISVKYEDKRCFPDKGGKRECKTKSHSGDPTSRLLKESARRGGDVVLLGANNVRGSEAATKAGRCLQMETRYVTQQVCSRYSNTGHCAYYTSRQVSQPVCTQREQIYGRASFTRSSATVWRKDAGLMSQIKYGDAFYNAVRSGDVRQVNAFLAKGIPANKPDLLGRYPIVVAVEGGNATVVKTLLANKANPNVEDGKATVNAISKGNTKIVRMLLDTGASPNADKGRALIIAARRGDAKIVRMLCNKGANVDRGPKGETALREAAKYGHAGVINILVTAGGNVNKRGLTKSTTPLMEAARFGNVQAVKTLLAAKANVNIKDTPRGLGLLSNMLGVKGNTALSLAQKGFYSATTAKKKQAYQQVISLLQAAGAK